MMSSGLVGQYEEALVRARSRFAECAAVETLSSRVDPPFLHSFLLHFCALGVQMTQPVEGWIRGASQKCGELGLMAIARVLARHAQAESGHHLMMIDDVRSLAERWNGHYRPAVDPGTLLTRNPSPGVMRYCNIHESNLAGATPYAQIAIEYEIEMLPLRFGEIFVTRCAEVLGPDILCCLSFITSHVELDVAHTKTNAWALAEVCRELPEALPVLVRAGSTILEAYAQYLDDCVSLAEQHSRNARPLGQVAVSTSTLSWRLHSPPGKPSHDGEIPVPAWLEQVRALRASVLFGEGRRPAFRAAGGAPRDDDPIDLYSHHILAYYGANLVGCLRVCHLADGRPNVLKQL